jgi:hypothetical protein
MIIVTMGFVRGGALPLCPNKEQRGGDADQGSGHERNHSPCIIIVDG